MQNWMLTRLTSLVGSFFEDEDVPIPRLSEHNGFRIWSNVDLRTDEIDRVFRKVGGIKQNDRRREGLITNWCLIKTFVIIEDASYRWTLSPPVMERMLACGGLILTGLLLFMAMCKDGFQSL